MLRQLTVFYLSRNKHLLLHLLLQKPKRRFGEAQTETPDGQDSSRLMKSLNCLFYLREEEEKKNKLFDLFKPTSHVEVWTSLIRAVWQQPNEVWSFCESELSGLKAAQAWDSEGTGNASLGLQQMFSSCCSRTLLKSRSALLFSV